MSSKSERTRKKILDTAWHLLEQGGKTGIRMADVAKASGISRQALYLHFPSRAELLIAATRHVDQEKDIDARLAQSRDAGGADRLDAFIEAWGNYIPEIAGIAAALQNMADTDAEARAAWEDRLAAIRHGCAAAVRALAEAGRLQADLPEARATDLLTAILSVAVWRSLVQEAGWSQNDYVAEMKRVARARLVVPGG